LPERCHPKLEHLRNVGSHRRPTDLDKTVPRTVHNGPARQPVATHVHPRLRSLRGGCVGSLVLLVPPLGLGGVLDPLPLGLFLGDAARVPPRPALLLGLPS
jgi:hypothetical protein